MTFVLSVHSRNSLWVVVDRRLSYGPRRAPVDDAVKVMDLQTNDGRGLLAYAGLGATPKGTQPSEWMSAVLRGRGGLTFERALGVLSDAANRELPKHLVRMPYAAHFILVPAFIRGVGARLYSIDNVIDRPTGRHRYRYTSHVRTAEPWLAGARIAVAGTGGLYVLQNKDRSWGRDLLRLVNAHDRGQVSDDLIADRLAAVNYETHRALRDGSVGPRCIVVWRRRPDAPQSDRSEAHRFYTGVDREPQVTSIPTIANGMDLQAIVGVLFKDIQERVATHGFSGAFAPDWHVNQLLADLPDEPDEKLR